MAIAPGAPGTPTPQGDEPDPSMDDILASIRRILNEDEKTAKSPPAEVLMLDPSMIVEDSVHDDQRAPTETLKPTAWASMDETNLHPRAEEKLAVATTEEPLRGPVAGLDAPSPASPGSGDASGAGFAAGRTGSGGGGGAFGRVAGADLGGRAERRGDARRVDDRGPGSRGSAPGVEGMARCAPAATGRADGPSRARARGRADRVVVRYPCARCRCG